MKTEKAEMKPSQKSTPRPSELTNIIEQDSFAKPDAPLPDVSEVFRKNLNIYYPDGNKEPYGNRTLEIYEKTFEECFQGFDENAKKRLLDHIITIKEKEFPDHSKEQLLIDTLATALYDTYYFFCIERKRLRQIADFFAQLRAGSNQFEGESKIVTNAGEILELPELKITLSRKGTIGTIKDETTSCFDNVDLDRIRICAVCNRIFWAKRVDSLTDSVRCFRALKKRINRLSPKEKAERKAQRENKKLKK